VHNKQFRKAVPMTSQPLNRRPGLQGCQTESGLPDGIFFKPKIQIWVNFGGPLNGKGKFNV
jgi:hypothetical protein